MVSVAAAGTAERIAARIWFNVPRAGSGIRARYSSTFLGAPLLIAARPLAAEPFTAKLGLPDFTPFMAGDATRTSISSPRSRPRLQHYGFCRGGGGGDCGAGVHLGAVGTGFPA